MARIAGVDIPNNKRVENALTYIYGIGRKSANDILAATGINPDTRAKDLTEDEIAKLRDEIEKSYTVEGDLRREVSLNIKNMVEINCYRGIRHRKGLPSEVSAPSPMPELVRVPQRPLRIRRSKGAIGLWQRQLQQARKLSRNAASVRILKKVQHISRLPLITLS